MSEPSNRCVSLWRALRRVSADMALVAVLFFFRAVSGHRVEGAREQKLDRWIWIVASASTGLLLVLLTNLAGCSYAALRLATPAFPHLFDQRYFALMAWCFLVPFVWGFNA